MASIRQKRVVAHILKNLTSVKPMTGGQIVQASGYGPSMRLYPGKILESKGVKKELRELGFSVESADVVVWEMLHKARKEDVRIKAAQEIYKRLGAYKDTEQGATKTLIVNVSAPAAAKYKIKAQDGTPRADESANGDTH
mgnify:CR=1 FL=1